MPESAFECRLTLSRVFAPNFIPVRELRVKWVHLFTEQQVVEQYEENESKVFIIYGCYFWLIKRRNEHLSNSLTDANNCTDLRETITAARWYLINFHFWYVTPCVTFSIYRLLSYYIFVTAPKVIGLPQSPIKRRELCYETIKAVGMQVFNVLTAGRHQACVTIVL